MASFIDWPTLKSCNRGDEFPFEFVVAHGQRVFPAVYSAITLLVVSSIALVWLTRPSGTLAWTLLIAKALAFSIMVGSTVYGTLSSWPKLQFAKHAEAYEIYNAYINRARVVFVCGVTCIVLGMILAHIM